MHIQSINQDNSVSMRAGLYFTKTSNVIFNRDESVRYVTQEAVKVANDGARYIEDNALPQSIKDRFANIPFIKKLSEKFDTFIFFRELPKGHENNFGYRNLSYSKISWADYSKPAAERREVQGTSPVSQEMATDKMFKNLEECNFCAISKNN